jgi:hypothetical protein
MVAVRTQAAIGTLCVTGMVSPASTRRLTVINRRRHDMQPRCASQNATLAALSFPSLDACQWRARASRDTAADFHARTSDP